MAAEIFKRIAAEVDELTTWQVKSAGTWAVNNLQSSENAQIVLESMGMDLSKHLSNNVSDIDLEKFDLILTMERNHKEAIQVEFPGVSDRTYTLSEMVGSAFDIADPFGGTIDDYKKTALFLEDLIIKGYPKIKAISTDTA
jgi:protein-tyrosine phosphatase